LYFPCQGMPFIPFYVRRQEILKVRSSAAFEVRNTLLWVFLILLNDFFGSYFSWIFRPFLSGRDDPTLLVPFGGKGVPYTVKSPFSRFSRRGLHSPSDSFSLSRKLDLRFLRRNRLGVTRVISGRMSEVRSGWDLPSPFYNPPKASKLAGSDLSLFPGRFPHAGRIPNRRLLLICSFPS